MNHLTKEKVLGTADQSQYRKLTYFGDTSLEKGTLLGLMPVKRQGHQ